MKILFADDDLAIASIIEHIVESLGHEPLCAHDGKEALELFNEHKPNLVILDVMMPKIDGFDVCNIIRQTSDVPIIFLTAKSDIVDKSIGFHLGADDYMVKPFAPIELKLRINVMLKRAVKHQDEEKELDTSVVGNIFTYRDLEINYDTYQVFLHGEELYFTFKEFSLLSLLTRNQGQVFSRTQLINSLWGKDYIGDINGLTLFVHKVREKIEKNPSKPEYLLTVWGVGYKFNT